MKVSSVKKNFYKPSLRDDERQFIEALAALFIPRGLTYSSGRIFALLLLKQIPLSVDDIAATFEISRAGAWNALQKLEIHGHVQRQGVSGSKLSLYSISNDYATSFLNLTAALRNVASLLEDCARNVASPEAAEKIEERANYYLEIDRTLEAKMQELDNYIPERE